MKNRVPLAVQPDTRLKTKLVSSVGVTRAQHGGEAGDLQLAPPPLAGLLEVLMIAHFLEGAFAVDLLLEPPQGPLHRFAFLKSYLSQLFSHPLACRYSSGHDSGPVQLPY
jgi:hypothetical protein